MGKDKKKPKNISKEEFDKELEKLQVELCHLQDYVKKEGTRVIVVFEGRDAAGKGGVIKRITERVSPRVFRVVALPAPSDREKTQLYIQRYIRHFPAAGEIILFDRSWYNRAGVERVMGFCSDQEYERFMKTAARFEKDIIDSGIILIKYFFDVSQKVQEERFMARMTDPKKHWKLSPMDVESWKRWWMYSIAYQRMIDETDSEWAPWYRVKADNKRLARLSCIRHLLDQIPHEKMDWQPPKVEGRFEKPDEAPEKLKFKHTVPMWGE